MKLLIALTLVSTMFLSAACKTGPISGTVANNTVASARQKLEDLPEPTFESLEVYTHDLSARGVALLIARYPDTKVPLAIFADSALSILEKQGITMLDLLQLSNSLDGIRQGQVKVYLDIAWSLLEMNGVLRRDDLSANLTIREQRLVIALCHGIKLGTGTPETMNKILNSVGPRYGTK